MGDSNNDEVELKRIKIVYKKPNPLFEKWLEEWKNEAAARNKEIQYSFEKALASLKNYPEPLARGKDCLIINHFGEKICDMLDKKLAQYRQEQSRLQINMPSTSKQANVLQYNHVYEEAKQKEESKKQLQNHEESTKRKKPNKENVQSKPSNNNIEGNRNVSQIPYIPKVGSAAYAILLTLYKNSMKKDYPGYMLKDDIIFQAGHDFDCVLKGSSLNWYGGWSGMTTLIEEQFVTKKSCPAKYTITDKGLALGLTLYEDILRNTSVNQEPSHNIKSIQNSQSEKTVPRKKSDSTRDPLKSHKSPESSSTMLSQKVVLEKPKKSTMEISNKVNNILQNEVIEIDDDDDDDIVTNLNQYEKQSRVDQLKNAEMELDRSDEEFDEFCKENAEPVMNVKKDSLHLIFAESFEDIQTPTETNTKVELVTQKISKVPSPKKLQIPQSRKEKETEVVKSVKESKSQKKKQTTEEVSTDSFFLLPNNFDIILLVDTQETSGGKTKARDDATLSELTELRVLYEVRSLKVGDFTWIARCRITQKELVLPYIVERKRIDDLSASITDGRYREQKHRLKQSGIKNITYLIESYGKNYHGSIPLTSLLQAGINSQVQDSFNVKYTKDHKDSMRYLSMKTKILTETYESKELVSCKKKDLESIDSISHDGSEQLMEFSEFNKGAVKTKNFKVQEMLIKQLLQLKGLSKQKAIAIAETHPTPTILSEQFTTQGENLLADIKTEGSTQKIGPAISSTLFKFYTSREFI